MKVLLHGNNSKKIIQLVQSLGFKIVDENPDLLISYGGDGTMLSAERKYPELPALPIRDSDFCRKCPKHEDKKLLTNLLAGRLKLTEYRKLHTKVYGKDLYALNDFVIRNTDAAHAIRFKVKHVAPSDLIIGDGIILATPFGSTGYFKSITGQTFTEGFALAFNNTTRKIDPVYIDQDEIDTKDDFTYIEFELIRGKTILTFDNSSESFSLSEGTKLKFNLSNKVAKIYMDSSLRCPDCKVIRD